MTENPYENTSPDTGTGSSGILIRVFVGTAILAVMISLLMPATRSARTAARRTQCRNNLKQIGLALHNYHDVYGSFPPATTADANGRPLHSWRTLLLPYLDQRQLYESIDLSRPWDDPVNAALHDKCPSTYRCPSAAIDADQTLYMAVVAPGGCFASNRATKISEITDGTSNTIVVVEVPLSQSVHWMAPYDDDRNSVVSMGENSELAHSEIVQGLMGDGSVQPIGRELSPGTLLEMMTIDGGEIVEEW